MANEINVDSNDVSSRKVIDGASKGLGWLWWLLGLIVLGLLLLLLMANHNKNNQQTTNTTNTTPQTSLKSKFDQDVATVDRAFYFNADSTNLQDTTAANNSTAKVVAFYKANNGTKLVVNGSIYDGQPGASGNPLAEQRAQLIKQKLVDGGVNAADITITSTNTYNGQTDAAKADYARSVTIDAL
jgi:cytoskeletal protein RodZ